MKKSLSMLIIFVMFRMAAVAMPSNQYNLIIAPGTLTENSVTLLWDKQYGNSNIAYEILFNGNVQSTTKTNFTLTDLSLATSYKATIRLKGSYVKTETIKFKILAKGFFFNILDSGAKDEPLFKNTTAIQAAPESPVFENFVFKNIDLSKASAKDAVIEINGFKDPAHRLKNVSFTNIIMPEKAKIIINDAAKVNFTNVQSASGLKPEYIVANSENIIY